MILLRKPLSFFAQIVKSRVRALLAEPQALIAFSVLLSLTGCSGTKQTWRDWTKSQPGAITYQETWMAPPPPAISSGSNALVLAPSYRIGDGAHVAPGFDLKMRNPDFPRTHIETVYIDLSLPTNGVHLKWTGSRASAGPVGPWCLTPGRGSEGKDCDNVDDSNALNSLCTPKGSFLVAGFADHLEQTPICRYATWILHAPRYVAIHSHVELPTVPASSGCVRMPYEAAKLIHNNSLVGVTVVSIGGTWQGTPGKHVDIVSHTP
ncbi:MAG: L,D-transpeptidase [Akkermansiaceae bacterium]|nr:L,D-transpeptidase [Verrucomicrobiales bacterium]